MNEQKHSKVRAGVLLTIMIAVLSLFLVRLIQWQVVQSGYYDTLADSTVKYTVRSEALRGEIYDVNGVELAVNLTGYKITLNKVYLKDEELNEIIVRLVQIMEECHEQWIDELPILTDENGRYIFDEEKEDEIRELKSRRNLNMNPYSTASECMVMLAKRYECEDYLPAQQRDIISVRYHMTQTAYSYTQPYTFAEGISANTMAIVTERLNQVKGVAVEATALRQYTNGTTAPHIVGVTGLISQEEYSELKSKGYSYTDRIGKNGIEAAFENELRGASGTKTYEVAADGSVREYESESTKPGNSVYLTLDARLQVVAQDALKAAVKEANDYAKQVDDKTMGADCTGAAVVMLNVKDFSVICAANYPSYDLAKYYDDYTKLATDKKVPLFDRAFMGALTPGSTFKPLVASAALEEKKITVHTSIECNGVYTKGGLKLWCMGFHSHQDLYHAMMNSCNVYFAETGRLLGIESMDTYARRCGLGVKTGVEVLESAGTLAGPEYSELMGSEWYDSFVSQAAIGQSDNQFTPLQLATYAATIANDGKRLRTHVVDRVESYYGSEILYRNQGEPVEEMGVSEKNLREVQKAMHMTAQNYEALQGFSIDMAGKTGTAENSGSDHANFICYAPFDDPQVAIGVMVEHGAKSYVAINVAKKLLSAYFLGEGVKEIPKIGVKQIGQSSQPDENSKLSSDPSADPDQSNSKPDETTADPDQTVSKPDETTADPDQTNSKPDETTGQPQDDEVPDVTSSAHDGGAIVIVEHETSQNDSPDPESWEDLPEDQPPDG